jgi:hypothetical protein
MLERHAPHDNDRLFDNLQELKPTPPGAKFTLQ